MPHSYELPREIPRGVHPGLEPAHVFIEKKVVQPRDNSSRFNLPIGNGLWAPQDSDEGQPGFVKAIVHRTNTHKIGKRDEAHEPCYDNKDCEDTFHRG